MLDSASHISISYLIFVIIVAIYLPVMFEVVAMNKKQWEENDGEAVSLSCGVGMGMAFCLLELACAYFGELDQWPNRFQILAQTLFCTAIVTFSGLCWWSIITLRRMFKNNHSAPVEQSDRKQTDKFHMV